MPRKLIPIVLLVVVAGAAAWWFLGRARPERHFTGFVEGEERLVRSEVAARVLEVPFAEGDAVPPPSAGTSTSRTRTSSPRRSASS